MDTTALIARIAGQLGAPERDVAAAVRLLDEGNTVPFIARYRKEATGGLDDGALRSLEEKLAYYRELEERKETVLAAIDEQGKLDDNLRALIVECDSKARLEDLYAPFKKRRKTRADKAREAGFEPLLDHLIAEPESDPEALAESFGEGALDGARAILADRLAGDADLVGELREGVFNGGVLSAGVVEGKEEDGAKYRDYFDFSEPLTEMPSHRVLALLRGEREGVLRLSIDVPEEERLVGRVEEAVGASSPWLGRAARSAWRTKLSVSATVDARTRLKERAEDRALEVFAGNLKDVLLAAPAGHKAVLGLDPGFRNGVKCAVVDGTGRVLDALVVYPHPPQKRYGEAEEKLAELCRRHGVALIAVGNGTASRETLALARDVARDAGGEAQAVTVSEAGASVYSASEAAARELPDMDVALRGAVSIARRLQDPLAELVKIDPKAIGVGQYQHDVNQRRLAGALGAVVEDAVNAVGVDVNTASAPLLSRVAGISPRLAEGIVAHRDANGGFPSREALKAVPRLGEKTFEQCAGFLRVTGGDEPLDASAVHPESYGLAREMAQTTGLSVERLIGDEAAVARIDKAALVAAGAGAMTVDDIAQELAKPGRDPRPEFRAARLDERVETIGDLKPGMVLEGTVSNVAAFGAFVDLGVHEDGLVHVSQLADRYVSDPREVVRPGQVVRVRVLDVDEERRRIGLSMRSPADDEPGPGGKGGAGRGRGASGKKQGAGSGAGRGRKPGRGQGRRGGRRQGQSAGESAGGAMAEALRRAGYR